MKKVKKLYDKYYPVLRLYKDDLEDIVSVFKSHFTEFKIIADEYELTDLSEIDDIKKPKITNFSVTYNDHNQDPLKSGLLSLDLKSDRARLYLSDSTATYLFGIASQIDALLSKKRSVAGFLTSQRLIIISSIVYILFMTIYYSLFFLQLLFIQPISWLVIPFTILSIIFPFWWFWMLFTINAKHCVIFLIYSNKRSNFLSRNKDQIIYSLTVGIFSAILGGVLTAVIIFLLLYK